jgi:DNA-binding PadR family transcriptional regulator
LSLPKEERVPIHHAVLGLLADGPSYGYELKASFEDAIGPQWGELNIGHVYQVLDRLVRDGLVTRREVSQRDRPDKVVYRLTRAGRSELDQWLGEPVVRQRGYRDDFFLKLFVASRLGPDRVREAVRVQRVTYLAELSRLAELNRRQGSEPLISLLIEAATLHTTANLRVAEFAGERAEEIAALGAMAPGQAPAHEEERSRASAGSAASEGARRAQRARGR